ncbi:MAG: NADPH-dependent FMN reductase [Christensenellales bacterium]|jgi:chromate reductase
MSKPKIVAIVGSLKKWSYNRQLAMAAKNLIGNRADFELLEYSDVPFMNEDIEFPTPEPVKRVREAVKAADGVWFFTPEHNHYFPAALKNLIDWLSRPTGDDEPPILAGKPAAVSGISIGMSGTAIAQDHLVTLISYLNMKVMNAPRLTIPYGKKQLNEGGLLSLTVSAPFLEEQVNAFLNFLQNK